VCEVPAHYDLGLHFLENSHYIEKETEGLHSKNGGGADASPRRFPIPRSTFPMEPGGWGGGGTWALGQLR
jgi:hypothetical protein